MSDNCHACGAPLQHPSGASRNHYFALLNERYETMPHSITDRLNFDQFRKHALIKTGWRDEVSHPCATRAEAERWAGYLKSLVIDYAIIFIEGTTVTIWKAKSQSPRAMGKEAFQRSKDDVLAYADSLLGVKEAA